MPLDLSFSLWFFYIAFKAELLIVSIQGFGATTAPGGGFDNAVPYPNAQAFGACMSFCVVAIDRLKQSEPLGQGTRIIRMIFLRGLIDSFTIICTIYLYRIC